MTGHWRSPPSPMVLWWWEAPERYRNLSGTVIQKCLQRMDHAAGEQANLVWRTLGKRALRELAPFALRKSQDPEPPRSSLRFLRGDLESHSHSICTTGRFQPTELDRRQLGLDAWYVA